MKAIAAGVMAIMAGTATAQGTERPAVEHIGQPMLGEQRLPFSSAVRVGDLLILSGQLGNTPDGKLPEIVERTDHPWFIGVQFHPEFKSTPWNGHPLFNAFIKAALDHQTAGKNLKAVA